MAKLTNTLLQSIASFLDRQGIKYNLAGHQTIVVPAYLLENEIVSYVITPGKGIVKAAIEADAGFKIPMANGREVVNYLNFVNSQITFATFYLEPVESAIRCRVCIITCRDKFTPGFLEELFSAIHGTFLGVAKAAKLITDGGKTANDAFIALVSYKG